MMIQKTYTLTDIVNGVFNWINSLDTKSVIVLFLAATWIIAENSPKSYFNPISTISKKPLPRKDFPDSIKNLIRLKQGNRCSKCRQVLNVVNFDHIDGNRSNNDISNCQAMCPNCHAVKTRTN